MKSRFDQREDPAKYSEYHTAGFVEWFLPKKGRRLRINRNMGITCFFIILLFAALIAYMVHFMVYESKDVIESPYNKRTKTLEKSVLRGEILSADGEKLAYTKTDDSGSESRVYPFNDVFAHVVGYTVHGNTGLESAYNYELVTSHSDLMTQFENQITSEKNIGDNLITTLDTRLQQAAYDALGDYQGAVIAIEPSTGNVRAMVSKPDFNPNNLDEEWSDIVTDEDSSVLVNRCTQGLYPPGSTYKVLTALEYIMENPDNYDSFTYNCTGDTVLNNVRIHCYDETEHGEETLEEAFANSCNTAFDTIGCSLDLENFIELNKTLLFNKKISSDLSIAKSKFKITENSEKSELPQTVIGQGDTLVTPMHNALIMCAIANDGVMMKPKIGDEIVAADGVSIEKYSETQLAELEDKDAVRAVQKMLRSAVTDGTAYSLDNDDYTVAGKTGTAENEKENPHSWFVGYSNVDDPDLVVCVIVENSGSGSSYAAPIAREIFDTYYDNDMFRIYR